MTHDRITYDDNGASLDEIVLTGVTFHMERMSHHGWWASVRTADGRTDLHLRWQAMGEVAVEDEGSDPAALVPTICPPLLYHDGAAWTGAHGVEHRCELDPAHSDDDEESLRTHTRCRCECGATRKREAT